MQFNTIYQSDLLFLLFILVFFYLFSFNGMLHIAIALSSLWLLIFMHRIDIFLSNGMGMYLSIICTAHDIRF